MTEPKRTTPAQRRAQVDAFNKHCPVGTAVWVTKDSGQRVAGVVTHPAHMLGGHTQVAWTTCARGGYVLERIERATPHGN